MGLRERLVELTTVEQVDEFLEEHRVCVLFKAGGCHKTMQGFGYVEEALNKREDIPMAYVKVIENRPVSNYIEDLTGVVHQSPQFILMIEKNAVYDVDNWEITLEAIENALRNHLGTSESQISEGKEVKHANVDPYKNLLEQYVAGDMSEKDFKFQWLAMFQSDATLRSTAEFTKLNSLFGDVDVAIAISSPSEGLKDRAQELLKKLEAYT